MTAVAQETRRFRLLPADWPSLEAEMLARWETGAFCSSNPSRLRRAVRRSCSTRARRRRTVALASITSSRGRSRISCVGTAPCADSTSRARRAGTRTGCPVEIEVEKSLGITAKAQIEALGVARFNELCRENVWKYRSDWEQLSERIGYWLDYSSPYITYAPAYIESVWWALATLWNRGLLYPGHKILPYCPRCETALSSHELALGYRDVQDPSVYVALDLVDGARRILVWTTTPWTLVSNTALAVHPELEYVELRSSERDRSADADSGGGAGGGGARSGLRRPVGDRATHARIRRSSAFGIIVRSIGCRIPLPAITR